MLRLEGPGFHPVRDGMFIDLPRQTSALPALGISDVRL